MTAASETAARHLVASGVVPVVIAARDSGLLTSLAEGPRSAEAHAESLGLDVRATRLVLEALRALGACDRDDAGRYVRKARIDDLAWDHLPEMLRTGAALPLIDDPRNRPEGYRRVAAFLADRFEPFATALAERLPEAQRILDVGAGSGVWSLAMALRSPASRVIGLDFDEVLPCFVDRSRALGLADRVDTLAGSYFEVLPEDPVDRVVLANVLHLESQDDAATLVSRFAASVVPGGDLVIVDCLTEGTPARDLNRSFYSLHLGLRTVKGGVRSTEELLSICEEAGLTEHRLECLDDVAPSMGAIVARRPPTGARPAQR